MGSRPKTRSPGLKVLLSSPSRTTPATSPPGMAGRRGPASRPPKPSRSCEQREFEACRGEQRSGKQLRTSRLPHTSCLPVDRVHARGLDLEQDLPLVARRHRRLHQLQHRGVAVARVLHHAARGGQPGRGRRRQAGERWSVSGGGKRAAAALREPSRGPGLQIASAEPAHALPPAPRCAHAVGEAMAFTPGAVRGLRCSSEERWSDAGRAQQSGRGRAGRAGVAAGAALQAARRRRRLPRDAALRSSPPSAPPITAAAAGSWPVSVTVEEPCRRGASEAEGGQQAARAAGSEGQRGQREQRAARAGRSESTERGATRKGDGVEAWCRRVQHGRRGSSQGCGAGRGWPPPQRAIGGLTTRRGRRPCAAACAPFCS